MNKICNDSEVISLIKQHLVYESIELAKEFEFIDLYATANRVVSFLKANDPELLTQKDRLYNATEAIAGEELKRFSVEDIYMLCSLEKFEKILEYTDKRSLFKKMRSSLDESYEEWKLYAYIKLKSKFNYNEDNNELFDFYKKEIAFLLEDPEIKRLLKIRRKAVFSEFIVKCLEENLIDVNYMGNDSKSLLLLFPEKFNNKELLLKLNEKGLNTYLHENNLVMELFLEGDIDLLCALIDINDYSLEQTMSIKNNFIETYEKNTHFKNPLDLFGGIDIEKNFNIFINALDMKAIEIQKKEIGQKIKSDSKSFSGKRI